jgi:malonyl-CoA O-methyltransferase
MSERFDLDAAQVRRAFARAARGYERHAALQREIGARLREQLAFVPAPPARVLDLGAGTGLGSAALARRYPAARVVALDLAVPMLRAARRHAGLLGHAFARVAGDALRLPFADGAFDLLHSNLCIQWVSDPLPLFVELLRVLRPGGSMLLSSFGPDTLRELRAAWATADGEHPHVSRFLDMHDLGDAALAAGLRDPVLGSEHMTLTYPDVDALLRELKGLGATNADAARARGLTGRARIARMRAAYPRQLDGRIASTWEVVYLHGHAPREGEPRRTPGGQEATFSLDALRRSRSR